MLDADADRAGLELRLIKLLLEDRARVHPFTGNGGSWRKEAIHCKRRRSSELEQNWAGGSGSSGVLRDCNDLELLTGRADYISNSFAHQKPCHRGYERNGTGLRVGFVLSHDTIFLYAPIVAPEGHRAPKGDSFG